MAPSFESSAVALTKVWRSVIPKACCMGVGAVVVTLAVRIVQDVLGRSMMPEENVRGNNLYTVYSFCLGVLIVFRNSQAYNRWWEGAQLVRLATQEWLDACCQILACTTNSALPEEKVEEFHHVLVTLFSLLICSGLQYIAVVKDEHMFETLDCSILDPRSLDVLREFQHEAKDRMDLIFQWILNTVHRNMRTGVIAAPPPIVTRIFHEMGSGTLQFEKMATISGMSLPPPYSFLIRLLLVTHFFYTCIVITVLVPSYVWSALIAFSSVFSFWCINYIASEIEHPFGDDVNDLPVREMQNECNRSLQRLLEKRARHIPWASLPLQEMRKRVRSSISICQSVTIDPKGVLPASDVPDWSPQDEVLGDHVMRIRASSDGYEAPSYATHDQFSKHATRMSESLAALEKELVHMATDHGGFLQELVTLGREVRNVAAGRRPQVERSADRSVPLVSGAVGMLPPAPRNVERQAPAAACFGGCSPKMAGSPPDGPPFGAGTH